MTDIPSPRDQGLYRLGYLHVALAATLWGASASAARALFFRGVTPFDLVQLRTTISALSLLTVIILWKPRILMIRRSDILSFLVLGLTLAAAQFTYLYAISKLHAATAILLQYQAPAMIAVYAWLIQGKKLRRLTVTSLAGTLAGCYLVVGAYSVGVLSINREGIIAGFASAAAFAAFTLHSERIMNTYSPWTVVLYSFLCAALSWNALCHPLGAFENSYDPMTWSLIMFIGVLGTVVPFGLYSEGVRRISATRASITATLEPVVAFVISYWFLDEGLESWQVLGAVLVIISIILLRARE